MLPLPPPSLKHEIRQVIPKLVLLYAILNALGCDEVPAALNQPPSYFPSFPYSHSSERSRKSFGEFGHAILQDQNGRAVQ